MTLYLVDPMAGLALELNVPESVQQALIVQWDRIQESAARDAFCRRMTAQLSNLIPDVLDWDIKAPTPAQLAYAMVLSRQLKVPIPDEARHFRSRMHEFIDEQSSKLKSES
jgi:hypothetical protein